MHSPDIVRLVVEFADRQGYIRHGRTKRNRLKFVHANGAIVIASVSRSVRGLANTLSTLRRHARARGAA